MSNLERDPAEVTLVENPIAGAPELLRKPTSETDVGAGVAAKARDGLRPELHRAREVPLGGPRAMSVHRTLPQRSRSLIGAWCFVDHYGPDDVSFSGGMVVPPHPHIGLQTVSWLFEGRIEHRDSAGHHALVVPGELDLMTAGRGIQHSEYSTPETTVLHGAQLWLTLPEAERNREPSFAATPAVATRIGDADVRVFLGSLGGVTASAVAYTPTLGAQLELPGHGRAEIETDAGFEHGVLVDTGSVVVDGLEVAARELGFLPAGRARLELVAGAEPVRLLLLGGEPLGEPIVMWWNFVGRAHDEIAAAREEWEAAGAWFGSLDDDPLPRLPAPALPNLRLRPRG